MTDMTPEAPCWLRPFLTFGSYHEICNEHKLASSKMNEKTLIFFELATTTVLCMLCKKGKHDPEVIQVYKVSFMSAVRVEEVSAFLDVGDIDSKFFNNHLHIYLHKKVFKRKRELRAGELGCVKCQKKLTSSASAIYCSISCKYNLSDAGYGCSSVATEGKNESDSEDKRVPDDVEERICPQGQATPGMADLPSHRESPLILEEPTSRARRKRRKSMHPQRSPLQ